MTTNATTFDVAAILDGDSDSEADILWYDSAQGKLIFWEMENGAKLANSFLGNTTATLDRVGDFDGDGDTDILLKTASGDVKIWRIQNLALASAIHIGTPQAGYSVIDTGDFNADGITDRAVFRSGEWIIDYSMNGSIDVRPRFGRAGDIPLVWNL